MMIGSWDGLPWLYEILIEFDVIHALASSRSCLGAYVFRNKDGI